MMSRNIVHYEMDSSTNFSELDQIKSNLMVDTRSNPKLKVFDPVASTSSTFRDEEWSRSPIRRSHISNNNSLSLMLAPFLWVCNAIKMLAYDCYMANLYTPIVYPIISNPKVISAVKQFRSTASPTFFVFLSALVVFVVLGFCFAIANLFVVYNLSIRGVVHVNNPQAARVVWV